MCVWVGECMSVQICECASVYGCACVCVRVGGHAWVCVWVSLYVRGSVGRLEPIHECVENGHRIVADLAVLFSVPPL